MNWQSLSNACEETRIVDRSGRRVRVYRKQDASRPGQQQRRQMALLGKRWCRRCSDWLDIGLVSRRGLCQPHANEDYRERYAAGAKAIIAPRVHARKRSVEPVRPQDRERVFENFDGVCAYCGKPATTVDHVIPVSQGGRSRRGNILPACRSCNSSKGTRSLDDFLPLDAERGFAIAEELCMEFVLGGDPSEWPAELRVREFPAVAS